MNQNYVGFGRRFVAFLVDIVVISVVGGIIGFLLVLGQLNSSGLSYGLSSLLSIAYYVIYQHLAGQTLGKKALGIKVVDEKGQTPSYLTFFLREIIGKFVSAIILGIGYLMIIWDSKKQGLHDKIAGTYVVRV